MNIEINLPDTCPKCGARMSIGKKRKRGKFTIIERPCVGKPSHMERLTIQTTFDDKDRAEMLNYASH